MRVSIMVRMLFIGFLMTSVLLACSNPAASRPDSGDAASSRSTGKRIPATTNREPPLTAAPSSDQPGSLEYSTVAEALADLKTRDDVLVEDLQGWTIVTEADGSTTWSFAPPDHPAFPAVAKRVLYRDQDGWNLKMEVLCEAETSACNEFVRHFEALNEPIYQMIEQQQEP